MRARRFSRRIWRPALALLAALLLAGAFPLQVQAGAEEAMTVRVGFFAMEGYHMQDASGARSGYGYDFLQLVARYSNLRFEYVGYDKSWDEMQQMLLDGEIDLLTSAQKTPEREQLLDFSANLIGTSAARLTVKAGDTRYTDGDYAGMRVGMVANSSRNAELDALMDSRGFSYIPVYYDSMPRLTQALQTGVEIDAVMTSSLRLTENEWTLEELSPSPFYAVVKKGNAPLLDALNAAIARMDVDAAGWRTRLLNKYYSMDTGEVVAFTSAERTYLDDLRASGRTLIATMSPDNAPYSYFENGQPRGIVPVIFAEVAARAGISYRIVQPKDRKDYHALCTQGGVDVILDGMSDYDTIERNGLEITDPYYTTPLALFTTKANVNEIASLAQPTVSLLYEAPYAFLTAEKMIQPAHRYETLQAAADGVLRGEADGSYMPYYCAQWLCSADETGKSRCLMLPAYEREFAYAVSAEEDYRLLSSLNKALRSLSEDYLASVVAAETAYPEQGWTLRSFVYQKPLAFTGLVGLILACLVLALRLAGRNRRAQKELQHSRRLERYIGYLCDMYRMVLEIDLEHGRRKRYMRRNGVVEIEEQNTFTVLDMDRIHPEDRDACQAALDAQSVRGMAEAGEDEHYVESRMRMADGGYRWFSFLLKLIPPDAEHPCSFMLLIKDVDELHRERERSHAALRDALDAANAASRAKSTFLSSMSHEIRTPLNAMIGYMTIAASSIDDRDKVLHCIDAAGVAARHLLSIINDVLDISSMESGKMKLAHDRFDLKEQLNGISSVFYQQCRQKDIQFMISVNGLTEEWVLGDPMRVNQILMNLMSNAVKFTERGGVSLTVVQTAINDELVYIRFLVKDTGIGMAPEYLSRLFNPFEQESAQTARKYGGTGLGMSITNNLVELMGGKLEVSSQLGEGSTFTVTLPFGRTENEAMPAPSLNLSRLHVLVVDDLENERDYIHALLDRCGVRAEMARSGEEAIRLVAAHSGQADRFDLCIIDWNMPELNGVETTRRIHRECDPDIPIIIATAYDISEFEEAAIAAGAAKIISKPLFQSTLFDLLVSTYGKREASPPAGNTIPDLSALHLLLAEDNAMNVEVAVEILAMAGVHAEVARNGQEALEKFLASRDDYDVILMDVQMPVMDGYAATRAIRASDHPRAKTIPIIAMTANAFAEDVSASLAAGMDGHLSKPIETAQLFNTLRQLIQK